MHRNHQKVAVLGAGIQGVCAALELASRGVAVDLFDRAEEPLGGASRWNEGKLHLGFIYAKDAAMRTGGRMIEGSLAFGDFLSRWMSAAELEDACSEPFDYLVHRGSMLDPAQVRHHFEAVAAEYLGLRDAMNGNYLGDRSRFVFESLAPGEWRRHHDSEQVRAAFRTCERALDPHRVRDLLIAALQDEERIQFCPRTTIRSVRRREPSAGYDLITAAGDHQAYDHVVNALWGGRLAVDASLGLSPARPWFWRYKLAIHIQGARGALPSSTTVLVGLYGDMVHFGEGRLYLSWYPACRLGSSTESVPPDWQAEVTDELRARVLRDTLAELTRITPRLTDLDLSTAEVRVEGGLIFTWGASDIDDPDSELHQRFDIGVTTTGHYHSIDTGKYCMAPLFARQVSDRIATQ